MSHIISLNSWIDTGRDFHPEPALATDMGETPVTSTRGPL